MAEDWDLYAIVRSCSAVKNNSRSSNSNSAAGGWNPNNSNSNSTNTSGFENNPLECLGSLTFEDDDDPFAFPDLVLPSASGFQELLDSYKPFLSAPPPHSGNIIIPATGAQDDNIVVASNPFTSSGSSMDTSFLGFISGQNHQQQLVQRQQHQPPTTNMGVISPIFSDTHHHHHQQQQHVQQQQQFNPQIQVHQQAAAGGGQRLVVRTSRTGALASALPLRPMQPPGSRSRKKKSSQKRLVLHVTVENLSNDVWAWRKYGQKPIKGSPYPRNYYRCSSTKGCAARKQVERSNTDPNIFIVSYSGEHNHPRPTHRNSLAGTTRNKFPATQKPEKNEAKANSVSANSRSPTTPQSSPADQETSAAGGVGGGSDHMDEGQDIMMGSDDDGEGGDDCDMDDGDGGGDDDDDDDDDGGGGLLIPNMSMMNDEDLIKDLRDLGSPVGGGGGGHGSGGKASARIFPSWTFGGSAAAGSS